MARAVAFRFLRDPSIVADVIQEATLASYLGLQRLRSPERFGSWFTGIALNVARRGFRPEKGRGSFPEVVVDTAAGPDELTESAEVADRVLDAVRQLPDGQREAVLAFYWQGLSHAEAALELGIQPGAVKARLHQARQKLAQNLSNLVEDNEEVTVSSVDNETYVESSIEEIRTLAADDPNRHAHAVTLKERTGDRRVVIFVGTPEGRAMVSTLDWSISPPYDLSALRSFDRGRWVPDR